MSAAEPPRWWQDTDSLPEWCREAFTAEQLRLPNVMKWSIAIRSHVELSAAAKHVGLTLATFMDATTCQAYPSVNRLAANTSRQPRTVRAGRDELIDMRWLEKQMFALAKGNFASNRYFGTFPEDVLVHVGEQGPELWQRTR